MHRFFFAALGLCSVLGCNSGTELPPPQSTLELALTPEDRTVHRDVPLGSALEIALPPPRGGASYRWAIVSNNNRVMWQTAELRPAQAAGAAAKWKVTFQSIQAGRSTIRFAALRPGQELSQPDDVFQVAVEVQVE